MLDFLIRFFIRMKNRSKPKGARRIVEAPPFVKYPDEGQVNWLAELVGSLTFVVFLALFVFNIEDTIIRWLGGITDLGYLSAWGSILQGTLGVCLLLGAFAQLLNTNTGYNSHYQLQAIFMALCAALSFFQMTQLQKALTYPSIGELLLVPVLQIVALVALVAASVLAQLGRRG